MTTTINAVGAVGSFATGSVNAAGVKNDGNMVTLNTGANRGWAVFDLSSIPAGSSISSVSLSFTTYSSLNSTLLNFIGGYVWTPANDPATMAGSALYTQLATNAANDFDNSTWSTTTPLNTKTLNADGVAAVAASAGGKIVLSFVRGSTNTYNIYGYPGAASEQPQLTVTYIPSTACVAPPTAGNAVSSATGNVCPGTSVNLTLSGASSGAGLTYEWQSSPTGLGGSYSSISSASPSSSFGIVASSTSWYRAIAICSGVADTSTPVLVTVNSLFPAGTYTINNNAPASATNFISFTDAVNAIACGISGTVVFNVDPGSAPYNEQVVIPAVFGTSATNTITFNGNGASLIFNSTNTNERAGIKLDGAKYTVINGLYITATGSLATEYGYGIQLTNDADHNVISGNTVLINTTATQTNFAGIVVSGSATSATSAGSNCDSNLVLGNTVNGGYYGITLVGTASPTFGVGNQVLNNVVEDFYTYGIYVASQFGSLVSGNQISRPIRSAVTTFYGVYLTGVQQSVVVNGNKIHHPFDQALTSTSAAYGVYMTGVDALVGSETIVSNNLVYGFNGEGTQNGMYNSSSDNVKYYHNTISLDDLLASGSGVTRGFYQTLAATGISLFNNMISISRSSSGDKQAVYFNTATSTFTANNNNYFLNSAVGFVNHIGYANATQSPTLVDWQSNTSQDGLSTAVNPLYVSPQTGDYTPSEQSLDNLGSAVGILTDIVGASRSATTPDIGAYEFSVTNCIVPPTAGVASASVTTACPNQSVQLTLNGNSIGAGQTYAWEQSANGVSGWSTVVSAGPSPLATINPVGTAYYRAVVSCSGNTVYSNVVQVFVNPGLSGVFTIDNGQPTGGSNFNSFGDAIDAVKCGLLGPVTLNVVAGSGPYVEQVIIPQIPGSSSVNTLTINGNNVSLFYTANTTNERAGIKLNGADYTTIDGLNIIAQGAYGFGVHLLNDADFNTISNCSFYADTASTSTNYAGIVVSGSATSATAAGSNSDNNMISGNVITGGYYGITLTGSTTTTVQGNNIVGNTLVDVYNSGIYVSASDGTVIENNSITRPSRSTVGTFYGIYTLGASNNLNVTRNKVFNTNGGRPSGTNTQYGVYNTADATAGTPNLFTNNLIYNFNGEGTAYGLANGGGDNAQFYHNTVSLDNTASTTTSVTAGIYTTTTAASGVTFMNNQISISRGGSGNKFGIYYGIGTLTSNYNNYFVNGAGGNNYIGYYTSNQVSLSDLQSVATGQEGNSVSVDAVYANPFSGDFAPTSPLLNDLGTYVGVGVDILSTSRSVSTPDIGAYEFNVSACTTPPNAGSATASNLIPCVGSTSTLSLNGFSAGSGQTYTWQASPTGLAGSYTNYSGSQASPILQVTVSSTTWFRAAVTCSGNTSYSSPVQLVANSGLSGVYTIDAGQPASATNFTSISSAVNALACGVSGPVVFEVVPGSGPYNEQVIIPSIVGASAVNTIVFKGHGNEVNFTSTNTNQRAIFKLNGARYVTIDSFLIVANGTSGTEYGWGIQLTNDADNNVLINNVININTTSTATNYAGIVVSGSGTGATAVGSNADSNLIVSNKITGGYYGITLVGTAGPAFGNGNQVINNQVSEFYLYGIYCGTQQGSTISGNDISRPSRSLVSTFYGVYLTGVQQAVRVNGNFIHDPFSGNTSSTSSAYGIYFTGVDAAIGSENIVSNNVVYSFNGEGTQNALYNSGSDNVRYYYNTLSLDDATATSASSTVYTRGFYQTVTATGIELINNLITIGRSTFGPKQAVYFATTGSTFTANHNDYYVSSTAGLTNHIGYVNGSSLSTLLDWQTTSGQDANSVSIDPVYASVSSGNLLPTSVALDNSGSPVSVFVDVLGISRNGSTPDIGAYEFVGNPTSIRLLAIRSVKQGNSVVVDWEIQTSDAVKRTVLERSEDGVTFHGIYTVEGDQGSSFGSVVQNYVDEGVFASTVSERLYYRVVVTDATNKVRVSPISAVARNERDRLAVTVSPNPIEHKVRVSIHALDDGDAQVSLIDGLGRVLRHNSVFCGRGNSIFEINDLQMIPKGVYTLQIALRGVVERVALVKH